MDEELTRAEWLRLQAARARRLADQTHIEHLRRRLLLVAADYEAIARENSPPSENE